MSDTGTYYVQFAGKSHGPLDAPALYNWIIQFPNSRHALVTRSGHRGCFPATDFLETYIPETVNAATPVEPVAEKTPHLGDERKFQESEASVSFPLDKSPEKKSSRPQHNSAPEFKSELDPNYLIPTDVPDAYSNIPPGFLNKIRHLPIGLRFVVATVVVAFFFFGTTGSGLLIGGTGFGIPVVAIFAVLALGILGAWTIYKSIMNQPEHLAFVGLIAGIIAHDAAILRAKRDLREAMKADTAEPRVQAVPKEESALREALLNMEPYDFEAHVMSFFRAKGLIAWVTKKSNDAGVDGFARHPEGLIVVQCKRNAPDNPVGRPVIQQFKGVIEENQAWRGYIVTTSTFSGHASDSADKNNRLELISMDDLITELRTGS